MRVLKKSNRAIFPFFLPSTSPSLTKVSLFYNLLLFSDRLPAKAVLRSLLQPGVLSLSLPAEAAFFPNNPSPSRDSI